MRLSKIKLAGFKSFVEPTSIQLPSNLIGIVGPNGCGKSNVIDAVRWVMGESSAKHLRGDSMADVIFNGSTARKPVGTAFIELVFDNSDATIGGQFAEYGEIAIKRQVSRDGLSSYFLNGTRCRRRDITDLFLGTGLGPNSYAIIEQGMISRLIEAKPEDLRKFLEEAAGISKYKERRRETENRMRHARENLERLSDLREEVAKQLAHLQRQAKTAERYKLLREEERHAKAQLLALRWRALDGQAGQRDKAIKEQETALEAQVAVLRRIEADTEKQREAHAAASETFNAVQGRFYSVGADIARIEQGIKHANERRTEQEGDLAQAERDLADLQAHLDADQNKIGELNAALHTLDPEAQQAAERERGAAETLARAEHAMQAWQQDWEEHNRRQAAASQTMQVERTRIEHVESHLRRLRERIARFEVEQENLSPDALEQETTALSGQLEQVDHEVARLQEDIQAQLASIAAQRERNNGLSSELNEARSELQGLRGRHASLEALQQAALGQREGAVTSWLEQQGLHDAPRLAQVLDVEEGWERAVECVLGFHLEAVCVDGMDPVASVLDSLEHGSLGVVELARQQDSGPAAPATLLSKVNSEWRLDSLLAGVYAADTLSDALAMRSGLTSHESVVTPEGVWLGRAWLRVARDPDEKAGVLHREHELKELAGEIDALRGRVVELEQRLDEGHGLLQDHEEQREAALRKLGEANRHHAELKARLSGRRAQLEHVASRSTDIRKEAEEAKGLLATEEANLQGAHSRLGDAETAVQAMHASSETLVQRRDTCRHDLEQARSEARACHDAAHQIALKVESMRTALTSTQQNMGRMKSSLEQLGARREELRAALSQGEAPLQEMKRELETTLGRRVEVEAELGRARTAVEEIEEAMRRSADEHSGAEQKVDEVRGVLDQQRMAWQELNVRRQTLNEQVEETGFQLQALFDEMPEEANEAEWQQKVEKLDVRIQRLGPINLAAIDEFNEQSERKNYLDAQHTDVSDALETLENAIRKIDRETRTRFKETYDKVNAGLKEMFPRLFGGGHAYLELTGEELLDAGVTIMARPPGKRNSTIHLLSGGEKALTAVALVFAIFELNPAPFCMLDEVDAPLDDANVGRFCELVKEKAGDIQFVYITHNKASMEMAHQLIGVTMHEPGVSRLVAVDVDEAVAMVAV